jgi:hypothetical protein
MSPSQGFAEPVAPEIVQYEKLKYRKKKKTPNIQRNVAGIVVVPLPIPE